MQAPTPWPDLAGRLTFLLALAAGFCLLLMVVLISAAVLLRYLANAPIMGVNELVQLDAVAVVMLGLPWCTAQGGHVRADIFDAAIGHVGRLAGDLLSRGLSVFVLSVLVQRAVLKALDAREFEDATNMLGLPIWPFYGLMAAGVGLAALILALQFLLILLRREPLA